MTPEYRVATKPHICFYFELVHEPSQVMVRALIRPLAFQFDLLEKGNTWIQGASFGTGLEPISQKGDRMGTCMDK